MRLDPISTQGAQHHRENKMLLGADTYKMKYCPKPGTPGPKT